MDIQELITRLGWKVDFTKVNQYNKKNEQTAKNAAKLAEKTAKIAISFAEKVARAAVKAADSELKAKGKSVNSQKRLIDSLTSHQIKALERLARIKDNEAAKDSKRASKQAAEDRKHNDDKVKDTERTAGRYEKFMVAHAARMATMFLGRGIGQTAQTAGDIEENLNVVQALGNMDANGRKEMEKMVSELSQTTRFQPLQILEGMTELVKAGYKEEELKRLTPEIIHFATASRTQNFDKAMALVTDMLFSYGMKTNQAGEATDKLTVGLNESKLGIEDLQTSLKYAAPAANAVGMGLGETVATLAILAQMGFKGSTGGTGFRRIVTMSATKDKQTRSRQRKSLKDVGIENAFDPVTDNMNILKVLSELGHKLKGKKRADKIGIANDLFGLTAQNQALAIMNFLEKFPDKAKHIIDQSTKNYEGQTKKITDVINQGFNFDLSKTKATLTEVSNKIGKDLHPYLKVTMDLVSKLAKKFIEADPQVRRFAIAIGILGFAFLGLAAAVGAVSLSSKFMWPFLLSVAALTGKILLFAGALYLAYLAIEDYAYALMGHESRSKKILDGINKAWKEVYGFDIPDLFVGFFEFIDKWFPKIGDVFGNGLNAITQFFANAFDFIIPNIVNDSFARILNGFKYFLNFIKNGLNYLGGEYTGLGGELFQIKPYDYHSPVKAPTFNGRGPMLPAGNQVTIGTLTTQVNVGGSNASPSQITKAANKGTTQSLQQGMQRHSLNYPASIY
jgi:TP901 family phage tail tape measure protein